MLGSATLEGAGEGACRLCGCGDLAGTTRGPFGDHAGGVSIMQCIAQICQAPAAAGRGLEEEGKGVARWETKVPVKSFSRCCSYDSSGRGGRMRERDKDSKP